jgi:hypothetical protein
VIEGLRREEWSGTHMHFQLLRKWRQKDQIVSSRPDWAKVRETVSQKYEQKFRGYDSSVRAPAHHLF